MSLPVKSAHDSELYRPVSVLVCFILLSLIIGGAMGHSFPATSTILTSLSLAMHVPSCMHRRVQEFYNIDTYTANKKTNSITM